MNTEDQLFNFFLVCPPGFEPSLSRELSRIDVNEEVLLKGGIEINVSLKTGLELNHKLKTPSKILLRLKTFKARDFPKLFTQISKIEWRKWLWNRACDFHVTTKESRLIHTGKVQDSVSKAIEKSLQAHPAKNKTQNYFEFNPQVYINITNDLVTVSIDTSYPPLYKRTESKTLHPASLRENIAYGCLLTLFKYSKSSVINLIDPMCGSGTFLTEALEIEAQRSFSYQGFPCYQYQPSYKALESKPSQPIIEKLYGFDIDEKMIKKNQENYLDLPIDWEVRDLMQPLLQSINSSAKVLISNPPYNKRLKVSMNIKQMIIKMMNHYSPDLIGVIVVNDQISQLENINSQYKELEQIKFRNGGIPCSFVMWKRQD